MISLPEGLNISALVSSFGELGAYIVSATVIILAGKIVVRTLRNGGPGR